MNRFLHALLFVALLVSSSFSQVVPVGFMQVRPAGSAPAATLFLDEPGLGGADAAYSITRKLRAAYAGSLIRVRRSSDSMEQDIGVVNNELDTATLLAFCSGTDGFVVTIYDQSGNSRNLTQSTASAQPQIVSSGTIFTGANSKPECRSDGSNDRMVASTWSLVSPVTFFIVLKQIVWTDNRYFLDGTSVNQMIFRNSGTTPTINIATVSPLLTVANSDMVVGTPALVTASHIGSGSNLRVNDGTEISGNLNNISPGGVSLGSAGNATQFNNFGFQELVLYASDKSSTDRTTARNNINAFYLLW